MIARQARRLLCSLLPTDACCDNRFTTNAVSHFFSRISLTILFCLALCTLSIGQTPASTPDANLTPTQLEIQGDDLRQQKMFADAIDRYRLAIKKGGDTASIHNKLGYTEMRRLHYDAARKEFERAVKLDRHFAGAYNNLGALEYFRGKYGRAIDAYRHALQIEGGMAMYHKNLANAYLAHEDYDKAVEEYSTAVKLDPTIFEPGKGEGSLIDPTTASDPGRYYYTVAKSMAKIGDLNRCYTFLKRSMEEDASVTKKVVKDPDFATALKDPRFVELLKNPPTPLH